MKLKHFSILLYFKCHFSIVDSYLYEADEDGGETVDQFSENMNDHFLKLGDRIRIRSNTKYLIGLSAQDDAVVVFFNNQLFHSAPLALNRLYNSLLLSKLGDCPGRIHVANWPIPFRPESKVLLAEREASPGSQLAANVPFPMVFIMAWYIMFYIRERESKAKLLQFITGVNVVIFWTISLLFDVTTHIITSVVIKYSVEMFEGKYWPNSLESTPLFKILILFGVSSLAIILVASFLFSNASHGFVCVTFIFVFTGNCVYIRFH